MTAMTLYLAEAHLTELRQSRLHSAGGSLAAVLAEVGQVIKGSLLPLGDAGESLGHSLRRDLGLD